MQFTEVRKEYRTFVKEVRGNGEAWAKKCEYFLDRVEQELGKPLTEAQRRSEVDAAILRVAETRKVRPNACNDDGGAGMKYRLGQEAVKFLSWCLSEGLIQKNVYPKNSFVEPPRPDAGFLSDEEVEAVLSADLTLEEKLLFRLFLDTGLRCGEMSNVKLSDIDFDRRAIRVFQTKVKRWKEVPFVEETGELMARYLDRRREDRFDSEYLLASKWAVRIQPESIRRRFRRLSTRFGFRIHPHKIRHTAGTNWVEVFGQIPAMSLLGHSDPGQTAHYTHLCGKKLGKMQAQVYEKKPFLLSKMPTPAEAKLN